MAKSSQSYAYLLFRAIAARIDMIVCHQLLFQQLATIPTNIRTALDNDSLQIFFFFKNESIEAFRCVQHLAPPANSFEWQIERKRELLACTSIVLNDIFSMYVKSIVYVLWDMTFSLN